MTPVAAIDTSALGEVIVTSLVVSLLFTGTFATAVALTMHASEQPAGPRAHTEHALAAALLILCGVLIVVGLYIMFTQK